MSITPNLQVQRNQTSERLSGLIKTEELNWTCFYGLPGNLAAGWKGISMGKNLSGLQAGRQGPLSTKPDVVLFVNTKQKHKESSIGWVVLTQYGYYTSTQEVP